MTYVQRFGLMLFILGVVSYWGMPGIYYPALIPVLIGGIMFAQRAF